MQMQKALPDFAVVETRVRQLIANGNSKLAVENAKELHKAIGTSASEALLLDAYEARIQALTAQQMPIEANALRDLVVERYPAAQERLKGTQRLDDLIRPLADPTLSPERRAQIDGRVIREVWDLASLAECGALPAEHPLRQAAAVLHRALVAVTEGPVTADAIELAEVSHRSPLAPWKLLVRAIAYFYRLDDEGCARYLDAIHPESAAARAVPSMRAMLGGKGLHLTAASNTLAAAVMPNPAALLDALDHLERAFHAGKKKAILSAITAALNACRIAMPEKLERLKQHIAARCMVAELTPAQFEKASGGPCRTDAYGARLVAYACEQTGDPEYLAMACHAWEDFRQLAVKESWFPEKGKETAALYLHIVSILRRMPRELVQELRTHTSRREKAAGVDTYFYDPSELYARACAQDPHKEAFAQWLEWERGGGQWDVEEVAELWRKSLPGDIEPVLFLIEQLSKRNAFKSSMQLLGAAERIDSVNPAVRRWRLLLLAGNVMQHLQRKKPDLALQKLDYIAGLPQSQQGDRQAFVAAARSVAGFIGRQKEYAAKYAAEAERLLGSRAASVMLMMSVASRAKTTLPSLLSDILNLEEGAKAGLATDLIRVVELSRDLDFKAVMPVSWVEALENQFPAIHQNLDTNQLAILCETALGFGRKTLAYVITAAGLERGGSDARFLMLRAYCLNRCGLNRWPVVAAAAVQLAREARWFDVVENATGLLNEDDYADLVLKPVQAAAVLRREKTEPRLPTPSRPGPSYADLLDDDGPCDCPNCRRERGESDNPFDQLDDDELNDIVDELPVPRDIPAAVAKTVKEELRKALRNGEPMDELMNRLHDMLPEFGGPPPVAGKRRRR
jgi:hypothetical protein